MGDFEKKFETLRSLVGVTIAGCPSTPIGRAGRCCFCVGTGRSSLLALPVDVKPDPIGGGCSDVGVIEDVADNDRCVDGACGLEEDVRVSDETKLGGASLAEVGVAGSEGLLNRAVDDKAGDFFDGSVLLL